MKEVFADSFYFFAILNPSDPGYPDAIQYSEERNDRLVTTAWVLTEVADGLARTSRRAAFQETLDALLLEPQSIVIPPSKNFFDKGIALYNSRLDKTWSLTDCISFVVMRERGIKEALTGDRHFEQAGFQLLLPTY